VQKQKTTTLIYGYANTRNKDRLYLKHPRLAEREFSMFLKWSLYNH